MASKMILAAVLGLQAPHGSATHLRNPQGERMSVLAMHTYRRDCGLKHPVSLAAAKVAIDAGNPGAGMEPNLIVPYETVLKDSFYEVECVADSMFKFGDKYGDNKHEYKLGDVSNVSIVHYEAHVAKEDKEEMTHEVCFSFCRTVPDMNFFGITNGRQCYCATYFKAMADDSSLCDAVCDGNPGTMCGGKTKSSIFGMHQCDNTAEQVSTTEDQMSELEGKMTGYEKAVTKAGADMQSAAAELQTMFGDAGDPGASDLMQTAKEFAGVLQHAGEAAQKISTTMGSLKASVASVSTMDLVDVKNMKQAEGLLSSMEEAIAEGAAATEELQSLAAAAAPNATGSENASQQYYPIMYFVDKSFVDVPSTCTGKASEKPMLGSMDSCAQACDADVHECVGFSYFPAAGGTTSGMCFLMSKMQKVKYYTACGGAEESAPAPQASKAEEIQSEANGPAMGPPMFAQLVKLRGHSKKAALHRRTSAAKVDSSAVKCVVKFAEFEGDTLAPNPSGKCDICLKEAEQADRCFG